MLIAGAEGMVRGASSLALKLKVSSLVIGLTVVSFGTSAPELVVNLMAAIGGTPDIAIGNIIGSNISNILLVLGVSALITPLVVKSSTVWKEVPFALLGAILLIILANDVFFDDASANMISRTDGFALLSIMLIFLYYVFSIARRRHQSLKTKPEPAKNHSSQPAAISKNDEDGVQNYSLPSSVALTIVGIIGLAVGGRILVDNAVIIAESAGLSQALIGITIIGIGTSLPELATSAMAALKKQTDLAIGNIIGSNIFNVFWIIGLTSVIQPLAYNTALNIDALIAVGVTALLMAFLLLGRTKHRLERWQGGLFVGLFVAYIVFLVMRG